MEIVHSDVVCALFCKVLTMLPSLVELLTGRDIGLVRLFARNNRAERR